MPVEITESKVAQVGRMTVRRALPQRARRTVGAWCFADHMGPVDVTEGSGPDVGPHPHMGLQTVTWLVDGQVLHKDSLGSEQVISPGQLNVMTAGGGVAHAEEATGHYRGTLQGIQLWVAQPEGTRHGDPAFEHHAELPRLELGGAEVTVLTGQVDGHRSPARTDTDLVGAEILAHGTTTIPLDASFEHALVVLEGEAAVGGEPIVPGRLAYLPVGGFELRLEVNDRARVMLLGGVPFDETIMMWWNFVGRTREEISAAYRSWDVQDDRFGRVASTLPRIPVSPPLWT